ncbi:ATP-binding protein [Microbotryomycetes sp. JL201]|nr:ATP-binding protein [Microbotryomycetes sp. JL201]
MAICHSVYNHYARIRQHDQIMKDRAVAALSEEDASTLAAQDSPVSPLTPPPTLSASPHVAQLQPRDRSQDWTGVESKLKPYDRKNDLPKVAETDNGTEATFAERIATHEVPPSQEHKSNPTLFSPSYYPAPTPSPTLKRRPRPSSATAAAGSTSASEVDPFDPTLYNSPIHDQYLANNKRASKRPRASSSLHSSTPNSQTLAESELLTDFVGQVTGSSLPPPAPYPRPQWDIEIAEKSNVLLLGPSGSGKTLLARTLARSLDVPFVGVEATGMTMAGYVGEDVETCIHRLLVAADWNVDKANRGIVFIDEVDKLARSVSASHSKDVSGEGVQQALLKILEGTIVSVPDKDGQASRKTRAPPKEAHLVDTTNILFILSGAFVGLDKIVARRLEKGSIGFTARLSSSIELDASGAASSPEGTMSDMLNNVEPSDLQRFGFIPEFLGRVPVVASLQQLTKSDLLKVLTQPKNALIKQFQDLFRLSDVDLRFTTLALTEIASKAISKGTGARGLRAILENVLLDPMYDVPHSSIKYVLIDKDVVKGSKPALYYSRGQKFVYENDYAAEQEVFEQEQQKVKAVEIEDEEENFEPERRRATA